MINHRKIKQSLLLVSILFSLGKFSGFAQPYAFFTADTNRINTLEVFFQSNYTEADTSTYTFLWDFGDGTTGTLPALSHLYTHGGSYRVSLIVLDATDADTFSLIVHVKDELVIPNVFTPNEDGINDFFIVRTGGLKKYSLTIFTRKGWKVTTLQGTSLVWDGYLPSGKKASPGVYYYILSDDLGFLRKGFFHLIY